MSKQPTIIKVRRGINGYKYSACDTNGYFIGNFRKLSDVRRHWNVEIKRGQVQLIRELDQVPDMSKIEAARATIEKALKLLTRNKGR